MSIKKLILALTVFHFLSSAIALPLSTNRLPVFVDNGLRIQQDRQKAAFDHMMTQLRDLHGSIYSLPYDAEYIRTTIIPEVNANRATLAPHYPDRNVYGDNGEQAYQLLRVWFETYPSECQAYMEFLRTYIDTHSN